MNRTLRPAIIKEDHALIPLARGNFAIIDIEDAEICNKHFWCKNDKGYVVSSINGKNIRLHIFLIGEKEGKVIDHINRNKLDNRKKNLRHVSHSVSQLNRNCRDIKTNGVYYRSDRRKFEVKFQIGKVQKYFGLFSSKEEAIRVAQLAKKDLGI